MLDAPEPRDHGDGLPDVRDRLRKGATMTDPLTRDERDEMACDWSDYRADYGVGQSEMRAAHKAFQAGWLAGRKGEQRGSIR